MEAINFLDGRSKMRASIIAVLRYPSCNWFILAGNHQRLCCHLKPSLLTLAEKLNMSYFQWSIRSSSIILLPFLICAEEVEEDVLWLLTSLRSDE